jgi:hypothetical protein
MKTAKKCTHPGTYHLSSDGLTVVKPHPQADTCFAREQGYVVMKIEPAYAKLGPAIVASLNRGEGLWADVVDFPPPPFGAPGA